MFNNRGSGSGGGGGGGVNMFFSNPVRLTQQPSVLLLPVTTRKNWHPLIFSDTSRVCYKMHSLGSGVGGCGVRNYRSKRSRT